MRARKYVIGRLDGLAVQIPRCFRAQYKEIGVNVTSCVPLATLGGNSNFVGVPYMFSSKC